ncbi:hypothetical protein [Pseudarthrobacter oxydans]|uniref:hypothetical protein n=1 Tax=Pseudarthrobacter oxydans TaxID=1671 RepID=UPI0038242CB1
MTELANQLTLFDVERFPTVFGPEGYEVAYCPACHSNWGAERARARRVEQERIERDHELQPDGRCAFMRKQDITEPFYTLEEMQLIRVGGWPPPYPRPAGFAGLYQLTEEFC